MQDYKYQYPGWIQALKDYWGKPVVAREQVPLLTGGLISVKRLANADARGDGPKIKLKAGKSVAYKLDDFLEWLQANSEEVQQNGK